MFVENLIIHHSLKDIGVYLEKLHFLYNIWINMGLSPFLYESYPVHNF